MQRTNTLDLYSGLLQVQHASNRARLCPRSGDTPVADLPGLEFVCLSIWHCRLHGDALGAVSNHDLGRMNNWSASA